MSYIIYNEAGKILRVVQCSPAMSLLQAKKDEFIMEGDADDATQKVVNGRVVNKSPEKIETTKFLVIPIEKQPANITNEQWQDVLKRLSALEN